MIKYADILKAAVDAAERRFLANEKALTDIAKNEGQLSSGIIEMQQPDIPDDAMTETLASDAGNYTKMLAGILAEYKKVPGHINNIGIDQLGPGRGKALQAVDSGGNEVRAYRNKRIFDAMKKLTQDTGTGGVFVSGDKTNPTVSLVPKYTGVLDDEEFTVIPMAERSAAAEKYKVVSGVPVAETVRHIFVRDSNGRISKRPKYTGLIL